VKILRHILLMLLLSLLIGFLIGTIIRQRLEGPAYYMGRVSPSATSPGSIGGAPAPLDVGHARALVVEPREHEEQVG
jgi:hypothetical protein